MSDRYNKAIGVCGVIGLLFLVLWNMFLIWSWFPITEVGVVFKTICFLGAYIMLFVTFLLLRKQEVSKWGALFGMLGCVFFVLGLFLETALGFIRIEMSNVQMGRMSSFDRDYLDSLHIYFRCCHGFVVFAYAFAYAFLGYSFMRMPARVGKAIRIATSTVSYMMSGLMFFYIVCNLLGDVSRPAIFWPLFGNLEVIGLFTWLLFAVLLYLSLWSNNLMSNWFLSSGRAKRKEYWSKVIVLRLLCMLVVLPITVTLIIRLYDIPWVSYRDQGLSNVFLVLNVLFFLFYLYLPIPVSIRRIHDRNLSGWVYLLLLLVGLIPVIGVVGMIFEFIILGCLPGTRGSNDYGEDPKAGEYNEETVPNGVQTKENTLVTEAVSDDALKKKLELLQQLHSSGLITQEEYEEKRSKIVALI